MIIDNLGNVDDAGAYKIGVVSVSIRNDGDPDVTVWAYGNADKARRYAKCLEAAPLLLSACKALVQAGSDTAEVVKQAERAIAAAEPKP